MRPLSLSLSRSRSLSLSLSLALSLLVFGCGDDGATRPVDGSVASDASDNSCTAVCGHYADLCGAATDCDVRCPTLTATQRSCVINATTCPATNACADGPVDSGTPVPSDGDVPGLGALGELCECSGQLCEGVGDAAVCGDGLACLGSDGGEHICTQRCADESGCPDGFTCLVQIIDTVDLGMWCSQL